MMLLPILIISHTSKLDDLTEGSLTREPAFLRRQPRFPRKMTYEERARKFHTDDVSIFRSGYLQVVSTEFPPLLTGDQYHRDLTDQLGQQLDATNAGMSLFLRFPLSLISNILNSNST